MSRNAKKTGLTPAVFHILLALSNCDMHGYAIMKRVGQDSGGKTKMGAGTLYGSLKRMLDAGLVEECGDRVDPEMDDQRRIYYRITGLGSEALNAELERFSGLVSLARDLNLLPKNFSHES